MKQAGGSPTYYDVLGIAPSADAVVISATYRALIKKYHPDANGGDEAAAAKARELNEAYEVLSDADARARYDYFTLGRWSAPTHPAREAMGFAGAYQFEADDVSGAGPPQHEETAPAKGRKRLHISLVAAALAAALLGGGLWLQEPTPAPPQPAPNADAVGSAAVLTSQRHPRLTRAWLVGSWVIEGLSCQGDKVITLSPDGSWFRQGSAGRWSLEGNRLHLMTTTLVEAEQQRVLLVPQNRSETITTRGPKEYQGLDAKGRVTIYDRCSPAPPA